MRELVDPPIFTCRSYGETKGQQSGPVACVQQWNMTQVNMLH